MILPVQTTFRNMDASAAVTERIQEEADKLDKYFDRIASCRVIVEARRTGIIGAASHFTSASNSECLASNSSLRICRRLNTKTQESGTSIWKSRVRIRTKPANPHRRRMCTWRFATHSRRCGVSWRTS